MPKLVDHAARRREIIQATWRLIGEHGADAATMREIAREAGFANGALTHYFADKEDLLRSAYQYVYEQTNQRAAAVTHGLAGVAALRAFCQEVLPLDELRLHEARVAIAAWSHAVVDPELARVHGQAMATWHAALVTWLQEASRAGEVVSAVDAAVLADQLLAQLTGAQILALSGAGALSAERLLTSLNTFLAALHRP
ncbi:TetR family transcriptional regulator [Kineococcus sp. T13]|uniref:TetR/AcrR family transcriptional regulator n=1 Tax=Kineococcus vitellinus TaxID=2696565 RepID=UPI00141279CC|nr:TetR/AcrR family transcriptional regulator [Kineococcus vitellinus]NAZ74251.1 TetR family transcriptional regulator [Kineococcus vitellinus]